MARIHLFELEDQSWFPEVIRSAMTSYLRLVAEKSGHAEQIAPVLALALERSGANAIVDLGSGGGGPTVPSFRALSRGRDDLTLTLSDLHPNVAALRGAAKEQPRAIHVVESPVDATNVPTSLPGVRALMNVFHHLRPEGARSVLQNAVDAEQPIVVVEMMSRHPAVFLASLFSFLPVLFSVPFLRPFRWSWLFWTYVLPVIPLATMWDAAVSALRVYSRDELMNLVTSLDGHERYDWEVGTLRLQPSPAPASYLIGTRKPARPASDEPPDCALLEPGATHRGARSGHRD